MNNTQLMTTIKITGLTLQTLNSNAISYASDTVNNSTLMKSSNSQCQSTALESATWSVFGFWGVPDFVTFGEALLAF